ncbi:rCG63005 [Rattus norvegicus]|uniref:RCG63005 n=1 Tax=Rattus norvegicus TaxID=10116 RepID=A6IRY9_RAT|nr:rCG63005 [Rattus norvegicus]
MPLCEHTLSRNMYFVMFVVRGGTQLPPHTHVEVRRQLWESILALLHGSSTSH